jgi:aminoglycoside 3-N-acetyltransferase
MPEPLTVTKQQLIDDLKNMGIVKGDMLNLKISLKSIGKVEGGADTVIDALLEVVGGEGTLVTDSFVEPFPVFLSFMHKNKVSSDDSLSYAGAITNAIMKKPGVYRATHPIQRFAAVGKRAKELAEGFTVDSEPYGFGTTMAEMGAKNLRVGGKDKVVGIGTTHMAIGHHGFKQKKIGKAIYYIDKNGKKRLYRANWANGCPVGFNGMLDRLKKNGLILAEGKVGHSEAILTSMKDTLAFEIELFKSEPGAFLCSDPTCHFCSFTWKASKYSFVQACMAAVKRKKIKKLLNLIGVKFFGGVYPKKNI